MIDDRAVPAKAPGILAVGALLIVLSACSSNGTADPTTTTAAGGPFLGEILDRCVGADIDARSAYLGPDGIHLDSADVGLVAFTLTSDTPTGSTAVLRVTDRSSGQQQFVTTTVEQDRKVAFVFGAQQETEYRWRLTVIGPDGEIGEGSTANEFRVGVEDVPCTVDMLQATGGPKPTE